jgi:mono/diheme cytochrome c family protein
MRLLILILIGLVTGMTGSLAAPNLQAGRELAIEACSACHQVTADQKPRPPVFNPDEYANVSAPPFKAIAAKYARRPSALRYFILNPVHPMPEQQWDSADLTAVVAFIQSLHPAPSVPGEGP